MTKPIVLYSHATGANPWKVAMLLEELGLPYDTKFLQFPEMKQAAYEAVNPNGRVPAIEYPNTGVTVFESGAVLQYLVDTYDSAGRLSYAAGKDKYLTLSWLYFQVSGQGPYFGQKAWFSMFHAEKLPSAIDRYAAEIRRVLGVVNAHLEKERSDYLVGSKCTYADIAWVSWNTVLPRLLPDLDFHKEFPAAAAWHDRLLARPAVKKVLDDKVKASASH